MADYTATVTTVGALTDEQNGELAYVLPGYATITSDQATHIIRVTFHVEASDDRQAATAAARTFTKASREVLGKPLPYCGVAVARGDAEPKPVSPPLVGMTETATILGVSRQRAGQLADQNPNFPAPVAVTAAGPVFLLDDVLAFTSTWERRTGRPRK